MILMASREIISTPFPSVEEVASELGVSPARLRKLRKSAGRIMATKKRRVRPKQTLGSRRKLR